ELRSGVHCCVDGAGTGYVHCRNGKTFFLCIVKYFLKLISGSNTGLNIMSHTYEKINLFVFTKVRILLKRMINSDIKYCLAQIEISEPFFAWVFGGIVGFETNVEADNKETEVIPKPDSTSDSQILQ